MTQTISDPRVLAGMRTQLAQRASAFSRQGKPLGWKAGFGAPAALKAFALDGPLAGYMVQNGLTPSGSTISLKDWVKPVAEPEIAIWFGTDLSGGADAAAAMAAIKGLGPAIELADMEFPPEDIERILAGNIYHRHVILGPCDDTRAGGKLEGLQSSVTRSGESLETPADLESNTGRILDIAAHVASTLAACGEKISAGDVLICGSITPPIFLQPGDTEIAHALDPVGTVTVRFG